MKNIQERNKTNAPIAQPNKLGNIGTSLTGAKQMTVFNDAEISNLLDEVSSAHATSYNLPLSRAKYIKRGTTWTYPMQSAMQNVVFALGMPMARAAELRPHELQSYYEVTRASIAGGRNLVAKKCATVSPAPAQPAPYVEPASPAPAINFDEIRRYIDEALTGVADTATQAAIGAALDAIRANQPTNLVVTSPTSPAPIAVGLVHYQTPKIIRYLNAGVNVYLHGPAGSGKTTACSKIAEALNLSFYVTAKVENEFQLLGVQLPSGEVVKTPFRRAYEEGGLFLFDELDASDAQSIVALNMALANGFCPFPDKLVKRHPNFKCIAAGNTTLGGASLLYQGRVALDRSSVDRFMFVAFGYDEQLEMSIAPNKTWCSHVQAIRKAVNERELDILVTPRATLDGAVLLETGESWEEVEEAAIWKGLDADTIAAIKYNIPNPLLN